MFPFVDTNMSDFVMLLRILTQRILKLVSTLNSLDAKNISTDVDKEEFGVILLFYFQVFPYVSWKVRLIIETFQSFDC